MEPTEIPSALVAAGGGAEPDVPAWVAPPPAPASALPPATDGPSGLPPPVAARLVRAGRSSAVAALAGAVAGALASLATLAVVVSDDEPSPVVTVSAEPMAATATGSPVRDVVAAAGPSVVSIEVETTQQHGRFRVRGTAAGSGVIISTDGLVLTNAHVVAGASDLGVTLSDGTVLAGEVVGSSATTDIAVVRIEDPPALTPAVLGTSSGLAVGDDVVAIGNALDLEGTPSVTKGIVSAKDRSLTSSDGTVLDGLVQTDAAINSGNSGGPLLDMQGRVVGINTAIIQDTENLGFAIGIDVVTPVLEEILATID